MNNHSLSFPQLFYILMLAFCGLFAAAALQAWTGPTATAPGNNVAAPINVGTTDQVKNAGLSVNSLAVFGSQYIQTKLGVGRVSPVTALDVNGTLRLANGGEVCQAVTAGGLRYNSTSNVMEYCDGTSWKSLQGQDTSGSTQYSAAGSYTFSVPTSYESLTVDVRGGGGGGQGGTGPNADQQTCSSGGDGSDGGASFFNQNVIAYGGKGGYGYNVPGIPGSASGGDTNTAGGGGSAGGGYNSYPVCSWASSGGSGGRAVKTYSAGQLSGNITVDVGAGGTGGAGGGSAGNGGSGGGGSVTISWQ